MVSVRFNLCAMQLGGNDLQRIPVFLDPGPAFQQFRFQSEDSLAFLDPQSAEVTKNKWA
jgi:hypothetical protein